MFEGLSPLHLILILFIVLLIFGPSRLPDLANALGKSIREFRKAASEVEDAVRTQPGPTPPAESASTRLPPPTPGDQPATQEPTASGPSEGPSRSAS